MTINTDDPKLTAYVLGELDETERTEIEAQLRGSNDLRREVETIRRTSDLLAAELEDEQGPGLSEAQRAALQSAFESRQAKGAKPSHTRPWLIRCWWLPTSVAASLLIAVGIWYATLPRLARSPGLATMSNLKGIGARVGKEPDSPTPWGIPPYRPVGGQPDVLNLFAPESGVGMPVHPSQYDELAPLGEYEWSGQHGASAFQTEAYDSVSENPFLLVTQSPLSTFSIDVDTASYANVRRFLTNGALPPPGAVRIEEMINYFDYDYPPPAGDDPFSINIEVNECPWNPDHRLARIGLKGYELSADERPPANLVFLIDVSGSMQPANKLPLLKQAMRMLAQALRPDDYVAMVVYAGASGLVLPSTPCESRGTLVSALERLQAGGSTDGGAGIQLAYDTAEANFIEGGINRVILATDGDFNVGVTDQGCLVRLIEEKAKSGVFLTVLGFGMGNYNDSTLEKLADKGNGNYAYIDTLNEARKVLVEQAGGTLVTIAKDVKIQVEFNAAEVEAYRLIGYENRMLAAQDFNDDTKDAGEIGAGHAVTALYEIVPAGAVDLPRVDPLKYQTPTAMSSAAAGGELMTVKLRYKEPDGEVSKLIEVAAFDEGLALEDSSDDFAFAATVASFGMLLRGSRHADALSYDFVIELAETAMGGDAFGYREEFVGLVGRGQALDVEVP